MKWLESFDYPMLMFIVMNLLIYKEESMNSFMWICFGVYLVTLLIRWVMVLQGRIYEKQIESLRNRVAVLKSELGRME